MCVCVCTYASVCWEVVGGQVALEAVELYCQEHIFKSFPCCICLKKMSDLYILQDLTHGHCWSTANLPDNDLHHCFLGFLLSWWRLATLTKIDVLFLCSSCVWASLPHIIKQAAEANMGLPGPVFYHHSWGLGQSFQAQVKPLLTSSSTEQNQWRGLEAK